MVQEALIPPGEGPKLALAAWNKWAAELDASEVSSSGNETSFDAVSAAAHHKRQANDDDHHA